MTGRMIDIECVLFVRESVSRIVLCYNPELL
jgi:hypothetical protein